MNLYLTKERIREVLGCSDHRAKILLRKYRKKFKDELGSEMMDYQRIPTGYFILQYSKDFKMNKKELCIAFGYDFKLLDKEENK